MAGTGGGVGTSERVALTTIEEWSKMVSEETERRLLLLAMMKKKGQIKYGCSGGQFRWVVRKDDHALQGFPDSTPIKFTKRNTKTNAYLPWRGYYVQDTITLREKFEQGGPEAMIKIFNSREEVMRRGATRGLAAELFKDGNLTANADNETFHGIESFMGIGAQTDNVDASIIATVHDDTYAALSTAVGGINANQPRMWTPTIINTNFTNAAAVQKEWDSFADEFIRELLLRTTFGASSEDMPDLIMLTRDSYRDLLNLLDDKERIPVVRGSNMDLVKMGFGNHVELDGCAVTWDDSVPTTDADSTDYSTVVRGYAFNTGRMQLKVLGEGGKNLFTSRVTFNDSYQADNIFMHLLGNLKFDGPRHFGKLADISSVTG